MRKPFETEKEFKTSLFKQERMHLAGPIPWGLTLPATNLPATPVAGDLAPTEDVQITPAIQTLADSLNKNPVKIHNWVRNNIEFLPTYGSIQGADMTLQTKRGNAFDTASLLIGLLRASNVPARYVYGTIEVPADKAMNWVGGVTKPEAAQSLLGQGGIPNIGVIAGGTMRSIKLEHVWVEAWVDYVPSRGAVNKVGDTWVKMDASFKQYAYTQGIDIKTVVPLDTSALITQAQTGATVNQTEGWVQNLNQANTQTALANYQNQVKTYIDTAKPNATVGDVLGTKTIQPHNYSILLGTLPYKTIATGGKFNVLPDMVRHQFQYNLYATDIDRALESPMFSFQQSLPKLAGKKITLTFAPASQADADLIASYLPKSHADGTPIQPSEFPTSLPGYLIRLKAELRVNGEIKATVGTFTMGQELTSSMGLFDPVNGWEYGEDNHPTAGEYIATHVDPQGVSQAQIQGLRDKLSAMKAKLETAQFAGLTKEDVSGDLLYSAVLAWFAVNQVAGQISSRASNVVEYRKPSFGSFLATAQTSYWFGLPRDVKFPGLTMDVDLYATMVVAKDNSQTVGYVQQSGMRLSAYEHLIPEKIFTDAQSPSVGVSAAKALSIASAQGQKIYTVSSQNIASVLPALTISTDVKAEIQNAISAGKTATVSQGNVTVNGWTGVGYILSDPVTGSGAYKISGGANGAIMILTFVVMALAIIIPTLMLFSGGLAFLPLLALGLGIDNFRTFIDRLSKADNFDTFNKAAFAASVDAIFDLVAVFFAAQLVATPVAAAGVELLAFWASIMGSLIAKIFF